MAIDSPAYFMPTVICGHRTNWLGWIQHLLKYRALNMHSYYQDLRNIKKTFRGISEYEYVAEIVRKKMPAKTLNILDIGIGDGHFSIRLSRKLKSYFCDNRIIGIDPDPTLTDIQYPPNFIFHNLPFELFHTQGKVDIILAVHSLYYFSPIEEFIKKISGMTRQGGIIFIILISCECILYKIGETGYLDSPKKNFLTAEQAYSYIKSVFPKLHATIKFMHGFVDLNQWLLSPVLRDSAYRIFSRNIDHYKNKHKIDEHDLSYFTNIIRINADQNKRTVGIIEIEK